MGVNPQTTELLRRSGQIREARQKRLRRTVWLAAIDELLGYLRTSKDRYEAHTHLRRVTSLLDRARGDFEAAFLNALEGLTWITNDRMRDVMEIEYLFREFRIWPASLAEWVDADARKRRNYFSSRALRARFAKINGLTVDQLQDTLDYRAHSAFLHAGGLPLVGITYGVDLDDYESTLHMALWEMLQHGRLLTFQVHGLYRSRAPRAKIGPSPQQGGLPFLKRAWEMSRVEQGRAVDILRQLAAKTGPAWDSFQDMTKR